MTQDEKGTPEKEPIKVAFSVPQIAGGALAAATAATIGSQLGVAGTIVGAAVASVVGGVAGTLYSAGLDRTHRKVTEAIHRGYEKVRTEDSDTRTDLSAVRGDATSLPEIGDTPTHSDLDDTIFRKDGPPAVLPGAAGRDGHPAQGSEEAKPARTVWKVAAITACLLYTSGQLLVDGRDVAAIPLAELRGQVGVVFQDPALFSGTIRENIAYGRPDASADDIVQAARRAHAHGFIIALPGGYDATIGERGVKLSGGQKQRIAVARAMLKDAPILVLDEATSLSLIHI